jgi:hypothetical protein
VGVAAVVAAGALALGLGEVAVGFEVGAQETTARLRVKPLAKRIVVLLRKFSFGKERVKDCSIVILIEFI